MSQLCVAHSPNKCNVKTGFQSHSKVTCINSGCWILTECALQRCSDCVCNSYYTPDRSLPQIHEVIFNNPEGLLNIILSVSVEETSQRGVITDLFYHYSHYKTSQTC